MKTIDSAWPAYFAAKIKEIDTMTDTRVLRIRADHHAENFGPDNPVTIAAEGRLEWLASVKKPSNDRTRRFLCFYDWAMELCAESVVRTGDEAIDYLHSHGFVSGDGTPYVKGARGIYSFIRAVYYFVHDELGLGAEGAHCIAVSFVKPNGAYAYA